ncbi:MFS transporter [Bacillus pseudomycoides]|uniref:MDR family MFS transporter n=1 Tax=Bacillus pseudomycoides TaxID=64104 RepID=UPI000BF14173|nr:MFS transporter [Bacillus pseudomycoides]PEK32370.1 MFS transporter [Bacillus pseudomycoides]PEK67982.1 MFS transporter [Bacillus pseudomycoides]PEP38622.1 MFS transporter [Bacillus pseudomycoides]PEP42118.1 MFS transporter [Bacillus pseudomycoides]PFX40469.1 MFS transporter [Bacillus pseudomycoides]
MNFSSLHRNIKIRVITSFFMRIVGSMIFPFMAIYFSERLGTALTGVLLCLNVILGIFSGFYGGYLADKIGRKRVMAMGLVINIIAYSLMTIANSPWFESVWITFVMFTINSICNSLVGPAAEAILIDSSTKENRNFMYSLTYWSLNVAAMIGSLLGGLFFNEHRFELFIGLTVTSGITLFMVIFVMTDEYVPKTVVEKVHVIRDMINSYKVVIVDKAFMAFTFAIVFLWSLENHGANYIAIRISHEFTPIDLHLLSFPKIHLDGIKVVGFLLSQNTVLVVLFTLFVSAWIRKSNQKNMLYIGIACYTVGYLFLGFSNIVWVIFIAGFINTIGEIIYTPIQSTMRAELMNESARGAYSAFSSISYQLCNLIGALGITLYSWIGSQGMLIVLAISGFVSFLLFRYSFKLSESKQERKLEYKTF